MGPKKVLVVPSILLLFHLRVIVVHPGPRYYIWILYIDGYIYLLFPFIRTTNKKMYDWITNSFIDTWMVCQLLGDRHGSGSGPIASRRLQVIDGGPLGFLKPHRFVVVGTGEAQSLSLFTHTTGGLFKVLDNIFYIQTEWISRRKTVAVFLEG